MSSTALRIELSPETWRELEGLARRRRTSQGLARRAQIVLLAADGLLNKEIVKRLKTALLERGLAKTVRACSASCLDMCETGVSIAVEPDHVIYGNVTLEDVDAIAEATKNGELVERLVVARATPRGA